MAQNPELAARGPATVPALVSAGALVALFHLYGTLAGIGPLRDLPIVPTYAYRQLHLGPLF